MPNWIEGTCKVRGKKSDIINFLENGLERCNGTGPHVTIDDKYGRTSVLTECWVRGTQRAFIGPSDVYFEGEGIEVISLDVRQAWSFKQSEWQKVAQKHNIDIRLWGSEMGMEFTQEVAIENGEITLMEVKKYNDWLWEAPFPYMGG